MAVPLYVGINGSGKSYEVVSAVIIPALAAGRRVVTNIDGLNYEKIVEYIHKNGLNDEKNKIGQVVHVTKNQILDPDFFPFYDLDHFLQVRGIVQPGDLICVDEAFNVWGTDNKIYQNHLSFFREHRHFTHPETGVSCDLVVISQSIGDIHKLLKAVVQETYYCHKAKAVGLNNTYTVTVYAGSRLSRKTVLNDFTRNFNQEIFPLYKSYAGSGGKEATVDKKGSLKNDKRIIYKIVFLLIVVAFSIYYFAFKFLRPPRDENNSSQADALSTPSSKINSDGSPSSIVNFSMQRRVVGLYKIDGFDFVVLQDQNGKTLVEPALNLQGSGLSLKFVQGSQILTRNSAPIPSKEEKKGIL